MQRTSKKQSPIRYSARLRYRNTRSSSHAVMVFNLGDIMDQVVSYINIGWRDLVALSHTNRMGRATARNEVTKRLMRYLSPFIPIQSFNTFFDVLSKHDGVICGSIVWLLISGNQQHLLRNDNPYFRAQSPRNLNIMVPCGEAVGLMQALLANDVVDVWAKERVYETHTKVVMKSFRGTTAHVCDALLTYWKFELIISTRMSILLFLRVLQQV